MRRNWNNVRFNSLVDALQGCTEQAMSKDSTLSQRRIADRMGYSLDSHYKYLSTGRLPAILIPTLEHACGNHAVTTWLATNAGKLVIDRPKGRKASATDLVEFNSGFAKALQMLGDFHQGKATAQDTLAALQQHLEAAAWHHCNVAQHATPELDFDA